MISMQDDMLKCLPNEYRECQSKLMKLIIAMPKGRKRDKLIEANMLIILGIERIEDAVKLIKETQR